MSFHPDEWNLRKAYPTIRLTWADGIYSGKLVTWAMTALKLAGGSSSEPRDRGRPQTSRRFTLGETPA